MAVSGDSKLQRTVVTSSTWSQGAVAPVATQVAPLTRFPQFLSLSYSLSLFQLLISFVGRENNEDEVFIGKNLGKNQIQIRSIFFLH